MAETIIHQSDVLAGSFFQFEVYIFPREDGHVLIMATPGQDSAIVMTPGVSTRVTLQMPQLYRAQNCKLTIVKDAEP
jgi:hypothetical protein